MSVEINRNYLLMSLVLEIHNGLLMKHASEERILQEVCKGLVSYQPYRMVWAGLAETDGAIRCVAAQGKAVSFLPEFELRWDGAQAGDNPIAAGVRRKMPIYVNGASAADGYSDSWRDFAVKAQISSLTVQPLFIDNKCIGALCVGSELASGFTSEVERALIALVAQHINHALGVQRELTVLEATQSQLKLFATVFDHALEGIAVTDAAGTIVAVNPALLRTTGYSREELIGNTPRMLQAGLLQDEASYTAMWKLIRETGRWEGEVWNRRKDGNVYPGMLSIAAVKDERQRVQNCIGIFTDISKQRSSYSFCASADSLVKLN